MTRVGLGIPDKTKSVCRWLTALNLLTKTTDTSNDRVQ